jgi:hypothetical protein
MMSVPDEQITRAIWQFGFQGVQAVQQERIEGLRNGSRRCLALRRLLDEILGSRACPDAA